MKKYKIIWIPVSSAIVVLLIWILCLNGTIFKDDRNSKFGLLPGMTVEEVQEKMNMTVAEGMTNISVNTNPVFETGNSKGNLCIENIAQNHYAYIVRIETDADGKVIYQSDRIRPGYYIDNAKLSKPLEKGIYPATAYFDTYGVDSNDKYGTIIVKMMITVNAN